MISKKILRLINFIFVGNLLLKNVKADDCTIEYNSGTFTATGCSDGYYVAYTNDSGTSYTFDKDYENPTGTGALLSVTTSTCSKVTSGVGYYKNGNNYFSSNAGVAEKVTPATQCTSANAGKLVTLNGNTSLCLAEGKTVGFSADAGKYLIGVTSETTVFNAETDNSKSLVIDVDEATILFDGSYSTDSGAKDYFDSTQKKVTDLTGCSISFLPNYYSCTSGVCTATALTLTASKDYIISVDSTADKYCMVKLTSGNNVLSSIPDGTITVDTANVIESMIWPVSDVTALTASPTNILSYGCTSNVCTAKDVYILYNSGSESLVLCDSSGSITAVSDDGYYINISNSAKPYVKCTGTTCTSMAAPATSVTCGATTVGQLVNNNGAVNLCLAPEKSVPFAAADAATPIEYLVDYHADGVFSSLDSENFGVVKVTADAMVLDTTLSNVCVTTELVVTAKSGDCASGSKERTCANGLCPKICNVQTGNECTVGKYYLVVDKTNFALQTSSTGEGYLFHCKTQMTCKDNEITDPGYYVNSNTVAYSCTSEAGKCKQIASIGTDCAAAADVGNLYVATGETAMSLCLSYDSNANPAATTAPLSATVGDYILSYVASNVFGIGSGQVGIVSVGETTVVLKSVENENRYQYSDATGKVVTEFTADNCSTLTEYKLEEDGKYYKGTA